MHALVTGAGGFLGQYIVEQLLARGDRVRALSRERHPALDELGVESIKGDVQDSDAVNAACRGVDCVFHVAAIAGIWGPWSVYHGINVVGTRNVVKGCRAASVPRLVYTSSPSVTFDGRDQCGVDESAPYPKRWLATIRTPRRWPSSTCWRQRHAQLPTCALRPHLIWGPRDQHLIPRLIERARARATAAGRRRQEPDRHGLCRERRRGALAGGRRPAARLARVRQGLLHHQRRAGELLGVDRRDSGAGRACLRSSARISLPSGLCGRRGAGRPLDRCSAAPTNRE